MDDVTRLGRDSFAVRRTLNLTRQTELSAAVGEERQGNGSQHALFPAFFVSLFGACEMLRVKNPFDI